MKTLKYVPLYVVFTIATVWGCKTPTKAVSTAKATEQMANTRLSLPFEKYELDNGLTVIMHIDTSDPVVAVALTAHVGSSREVAGRTGFAHLFEHLLFLESENLGKGGLDAMSARIGGAGANGSTNRDVTNYFQTVPNDALEKMIWAEADKLGFFINTVTDQVLAKEKQVVKNEKRQSVDNQPYGGEDFVIDKNLYPATHPYNWQVIGSLEDLQNASLQDVKDFYNRWYTTNNTTLTISGDFNVTQAKSWVKQYFGEFKAGKDVAERSIEPVILNGNTSLFYEDNFANLPRLTRNWPTVKAFHKDTYALDVLADYLSSGKKAPLTQVLVENKKLTSNARMRNYSSELAGQLQLAVQAYDGVDLDVVAAAIDEALLLFEKDGIPQKDLDRIKTATETSFYYQLGSALGKGFLLTQYDIYTGDPGYIEKDIKGVQSVTRQDVMRVYNTYIKNKNYVMTSFVPKGMTELAVANSKPAFVEEEKIVQGAEEDFDASVEASYERTPSTFDRTVEPVYGAKPQLRIPVIWNDTYNSGMRVMGIENNEVPLVSLELALKTGLLQEQKETYGVSNMLAQLLAKGTKNKTTEELENELQNLGATLNLTASYSSMSLNANTLARNLNEVAALMKEVLLEPRWDLEEFELIKQQTIDRIQRLKSNPNAIAAQQFNKLLYGESHVLAQNLLGSEETVKAITLQDLKDYYTSYVLPQVLELSVVGAATKTQIATAFKLLDATWNAAAVVSVSVQAIPAIAATQVYFYDVPGAKQSVIYAGQHAVKATDPIFYPLEVINYRLGGGGFASQLMQELREGKGYTYGVSSSFSGNELSGVFAVRTSVRSNVTLESAQLIKELLSDYGNSFNESDLEVTKSYMIKSSARSFETAGAKLNMLSDIRNYGYPADYGVKNQQFVELLTLPVVKQLASQNLNANQMIYLIVGDAATQLNRMGELGYGTPVLLNKK
jgi:zinc protease